MKFVLLAVAYWVCVTALGFKCGIQAAVLCILATIITAYLAVNVCIVEECDDEQPDE